MLALAREQGRGASALPPLLEAKTMVRKAAVSVRLPVRRGLTETEAAVYLSLSPSFFRQLIARGMMPRPRVVGRRRIWDAEELDLAFRELPREGEYGRCVEVGEDSWSDYE